MTLTRRTPVPLWSICLLGADLGTTAEHLSSPRLAVTGCERGHGPVDDRSPVAGQVGESVPVLVPPGHYLLH